MEVNGEVSKANHVGKRVVLKLIMWIFILIFFFLFQNNVNASIKSKIINNFKITKNLKFNFIQKIGKKIE